MNVKTPEAAADIAETAENMENIDATKGDLGGAVAFGAAGDQWPAGKLRCEVTQLRCVVLLHRLAL